MFNPVFYSKKYGRQIPHVDDWQGPKGRSLCKEVIYKFPYGKRFNLSITTPERPYLIDKDKNRFYPTTPGAIALIEEYDLIRRLLASGPICIVLEDNVLTIIGNNKTYKLELEHAYFLGLSQQVVKNIRKHPDVECKDSLKCMVHMYEARKRIYKNPHYLFQSHKFTLARLDKKFDRQWIQEEKNNYPVNVMDSIIFSQLPDPWKEEVKKYYSLYKYERMTVDEIKEFLEMPNSQNIVQIRVCLQIKNKEELVTYTKLASEYKLYGCVPHRIMVVRLYDGTNDVVPFST